VPPEQTSVEQATPEQTQQVPLEQMQHMPPMHDAFGTSSEEGEEGGEDEEEGVSSSSRPTTGSLLFLSSTLFLIITLSFV
jgi:hypothetical protein